MSNNLDHAGQQPKPANKVESLFNAIKSIELISKDLESLSIKIRGNDVPINEPKDMPGSVPLLEIMTAGPDSIHSEIDRARGMIREIEMMLF